MARIGRPPVPRAEVHCFACNLSMMRRSTEVEASITKRFFCSLACQRQVGARPRTGESRACLVCGAAFYAAGKSPQKMCSRVCADAYQARNIDRRTCQYCAGEFLIARGDPDIYCSRNCYDLHKRERAVGSKFTTKDGYVRVFQPDHPNADANGNVAEHRLVMEEALGRLLVAKENVHHRNGARADNLLGNLELWNVSQPAGQRVEDKVQYAYEILALYGTPGQREEFRAFLPPELRSDG